ncbi:hypothetical protein B0A58_05495 [Flavobacterium branchiophilum NBRC 15030 = ATCC 35035]|uniref:Quinol monooxygenase YgiN n=1 Tax=Flavobacterium branchiophilum TaxID=55197 RepID=A0A543G2Z7_9FLAO|nr:putative quinol monooxygenase [Flavobacterium branchiophilum]OXA77471.1 hypothetical protein B0A58_05495 [Flavobacterium branchiophilum NBRC 15030 = ATCC 35035]TQM40466.1 quinol monooxygenase YgiN [Flavobacterium branchiophilum]GEM56217.1 hypothetical protein FB1_24380 [Flavobacterium branchiophilum NBRC 15030 = ATCC 35035]
MTSKIYVTAKFTVKKEKLDEAIALMKNLTSTTTQTEKGCVAYYYLQSITNSCEFTSCEIWENENDEAKHWETAHVQNALKALPHLLETLPEIVKWKDLN